MDEARIRQIFQEEFAKKIGQDKYVFTRNVQLANGRNIELAKDVGTNIGTETTQKLGFWGVTPVVQPTAVSDLSGAGGAVDGTARTGVNDILSRLRAVGIIAT